MRGGLAAALAFGAQGVWMGTRFIASREGRAADAYKQAILDAVAGIASLDGRLMHESQLISRKQIPTIPLRLTASFRISRVLLRHWVGWRTGNDPSKSSGYRCAAINPCRPPVEHPW